MKAGKKVVTSLQKAFILNSISNAVILKQLLKHQLRCFLAIFFLEVLIDDPGFSRFILISQGCSQLCIIFCTWLQLPWKKWLVLKNKGLNNQPVFFLSLRRLTGNHLVILSRDSEKVRRSAVRSLETKRRAFIAKFHRPVDWVFFFQNKETTLERADF